MPISIACPSCLKELKIPEARAGKRLSCPACHHSLTVPVFHCPNCDGVIPGATVVLGRECRCPSCEQVVIVRTAVPPTASDSSQGPKADPIDPPVHPEVRSPTPWLKHDDHEVVQRLAGSPPLSDKQVKERRTEPEEDDHCLGTRTSVLIACPNCQGILKVPEAKAGANFPCPLCGHVLSAQPPLDQAQKACDPVAVFREAGPVLFHCPSCKTLIRVELSGQKCLCPSCGQKILIPSPPANKTTLGILPSDLASQVGTLSQEKEAKRLRQEQENYYDASENP